MSEFLVAVQNGEDLIGLLKPVTIGAVPRRDDTVVLPVLGTVVKVSDVVWHVDHAPTQIYLIGRDDEPVPMDDAQVDALATDGWMRTDIN